MKKTMAAVAFSGCLLTGTAQAASGLVCQLIDVDSLKSLQMTVDFGMLWGATTTLFIEGYPPDTLDADVKTTQWTYTLKVQIDGSRMLEAIIDRTSGAATVSYASNSLAHHERVLPP